MALSHFVHLYNVVGGVVGFALTLDVSLLQDGVTALLLASKNDHINVVGLLLENGALVNKVEQY